MTVRAAVYARISNDPADSRLGVARQEEDCRVLAQAKGWAVTQVFIDNDATAADRRKPRPAYRRLLVAIESGEVNAVVVWALDRLHRRPAELEEFFEVCESAGLRHLASVGGDVDLATGDGKLVARIKGAVDADEIEKIRRRVRRKHEELAAQGRFKGGTRPYGYEADGMTVRPGEAAVIRSAVDRLLAGESLGAIVRDLRRDEVTTAHGRTWTTTTLRRLLESPRLAGLRAHRGEVVGDAAWPAVISRSEHERLKAMFSDPARRRGGRPYTWLLSRGLARCGRCGAAMRSFRSGRAPIYRCAGGGLGHSEQGCGRVNIRAQPFEELVRDVVLAALAGPDLQRTLEAQRGVDQRHAERLEQLRADEDALAELDIDYYERRVIDRGRFMHQAERITERMEATRRAIRRSEPVVLRDLPTDEDTLRIEWERRSIEWRRLLLGEVLTAVVVKPATRGGRMFDPDRVEFAWRA